ncbi:MAG: integrase [Bacteroidales bacterium]
MNPYEERKQAINRHLNGEKVSKIVKSLKRSREWFYFWLNRYKASEEGDDWYLDASRSPRRKPSKISSDIERGVIEARISLQEERYAQTGAIAIQYEMYRLGQEPPAIWTINRILTRHGLNKPSRIKRKRSEKDYPMLFIHTHQMDLVGPRYIKGDGRFYSVNILDTECHSCFVHPIRCKSTEEILRALVLFWSNHGMPDALQMDNELAFRGSNRYPRSFGAIIRLALALNIAPVFIPIKEPWRNGMIEKFNDTFDKHFIRKWTFESFQHLCHEAVNFSSFHNAKHRYRALEKKTPVETRLSLPPLVKYDQSIDLTKKIPLVTGTVYFVRFIRSDLILKLHTEKFKVKEELKYSYVVAEVNIDNQCMIVRRDNEIVQIFPYNTPFDW